MRINDLNENHTYEYPPLLELCECDELFIYLSEGNYIFDRSILPTEIDSNAS